MKTETMIFLCGLAVAFASCFFVLIATGAMHTPAPEPCFRIDCRTVAHSHEPEEDCPGTPEFTFTEDECTGFESMVPKHCHEWKKDDPLQGFRGAIEDVKNRHTAKVPPLNPEIVPPGTVPKYERTGWTCSTCGATFHTWQAVEEHLPCNGDRGAKSDE